MIKTLDFDLIGLYPEDGLLGMFNLAKKYNFDALEVSPKVIEEYGVEKAKELMKQTGLLINSFGLPFKPTEISKEDYDLKMCDFAKQVQIMKEVGCKVCFTFVRSSSDDYEYDENKALTIERYKPIASLLAENGMKLALEFLGPLTSQKKKKYPFVRRAEELLPICKEIGENCGLLFDFWHWYSGSNDKNVFDKIDGVKYINHIHLNDALEGNVDELQDKPRELVGMSGVIDTKFLVGKLKELGYEGAVVSESFSTKLEDKTLEERVALIKQAIDKAID